MKLKQFLAMHQIMASIRLIQRFNESELWGYEQMEITIQPTKKVYLYLYTDSIGFPRIKDQSPDITWPFLLRYLLEYDSKLSVYPYMRGLGGARIKDVEEIFNRDSSYFKEQGDDSYSFVIYNIGIVDAAPRPFTYHLKKLGKIPLAGPYLWFFISKMLHPFRSYFQKIYSYRLTSPRDFRNSFNRMVKRSIKVGISPISIDTPFTPVALEDRSPGLRHSISLYNSLKHSNSSVVHVPTDWVNDEHYDEDGHHFSQAGHQELAQRLHLVIRGLINA